MFNQSPCLSCVQNGRNLFPDNQQVHSTYILHICVHMSLIFVGLVSQSMTKTDVSVQAITYPHILLSLHVIMDSAGIDYHMILAGNLFQQFLNNPGVQQELLRVTSHDIFLQSCCNMGLSSHCQNKFPTKTNMTINTGRLWQSLLSLFTLQAHMMIVIFFRYLIVTCTNQILFFISSLYCFLQM